MIVQATMILRKIFELSQKEKNRFENGFHVHSFINNPFCIIIE